jgi:5'-3' exonuclease
VFLLLVVVELILFYLFSHSFIYRKRAQEKAKAEKLKSEGVHEAAAAAYARAVTITPEMVAAAVAALQQQGLQCVVALGEADAELAYLYQLKVIDLVVTEDSDALITGCERVCNYYYYYYFNDSIVGFYLL